MTEEPILVNSSLSQKISSGGRTVTVEIYKLEHEKSWMLEIVDQFNNSTVWDDTFSTESAALTEAKKAILENKVSNFIGPEDGKSNDEWR
jgi:16S rRNA U1498 N3-methylase RsmE